MKNKFRGELLFIAFLTILSAILFLKETDFDKRVLNTNKVKARVIKVDNSIIEHTTIIKMGSQILEVEIIEGKYKGEKIKISNQLLGKLDFDEFYQKGEIILAEFSTDKNGKIVSGVARGVYRLTYIFILFGIFSFMLILVAGTTGLKALLSFIFSALLLWKIMIPLFLKGYDPLWIALMIITSLVIVISFLIGGFTKLGFSAASGSIMGLILTCILTEIFIKPLKIHGAVLPFSESLLYSGFGNINLLKLFIASIFIASSGAIMDISMDVAAAIKEIKEKHPLITMKELIKSGLFVGRAVLGTMTTTLLFAYSGGYITMLMFFMGMGIPWQNIINLPLVSSEILKTLVGSFGLIAVAPITAIIAGYIYSYKKN